MRNSSDEKLATIAWIGAGVSVLVFALVMLSAYRGTRFWTNGKEIRTPASSAPVRRILWLPARPALEKSEADQYEPKVSADGLTMVFVRRRAGSNADLFESRWTPNGWSEARAIGAIGTEKDELGPELSRDGTELYFYSDRAGGLGGYDLWAAKRDEGGAWGEARNLGPTVNSGANEYGPALSPDGKTLYFASNRLRPGESARDSDDWPATMREKRSRHDYDLYGARAGADGDRSGGWEGRWGAAFALNGLNTEFDEGSPAASPAGDFLYFASDRPGGLGGFDLYRSRLFVVGSEESLSPPENLGDAVNSAQNDLDAGLSADGFRLFFSSDRAIGGRQESASADAEAEMQAARYALWSTASREVFIEVESGTRLARLWGLIVPLLPWIGALLLALIPLVLLAWMLRNELWRGRLGRLSLLAQCLLISLFVHGLITAGMAVWKVGSGIADAVRSGDVGGGGGGTRVVLTSSAPVGDDAGEITGGLSGQLFSSALSEPIAMQVPVVPAGELPLRAEIGGAGSQGALPSAPELPTRLSIMTDGSVPDRADASMVARAPDVESSVRAAVPAPSERARASEEASASMARPMMEMGRRLESLAGGQVRIDVPRLELPAGTGAPIDRLDVRPGGVFESASDDEQGAQPRLAAHSGDIGAALPKMAGSTATEASAMRVPAVRVSEMDAPVGVSVGGPVGAPEALPLPRASMGSERIAIQAPTNGVGAEAQDTRSTSVPGALRDSAVNARIPEKAERVVAGEPDLGAKMGEFLIRTGNAGGGEPMSGQAPVAGGEISQGERLALPASAVRTERLPTEGFGSGSARTSEATLGGAVFDASILGLPSGGLSRLPAEIAEPVKPVESFEQRKPESREEMLAAMGGSAETERAVGRALEWFARHQEADGRWSGKNFDARCDGCDGGAEIDADAAMTGIVLLCYLGAGHTHMSEGPYRERVERALGWLVGRQAASGDLRRGETMYGQTIATVALCEALSMTRDQRLAMPARRGVDFVLRAAARGGTGTGGVREEDTSVLGWLVMTVESARRAGIAVPRDVFEAADRWLDRVGDAGAPGRYAYAPGGPPSPAMTAEAMFVRQILGHGREEAMMKASAEYVLSAPPKWDGAAPTYHWYYASLALFQQQGEAWNEWNRALAPILVKQQRKNGPAAGSWDPQDEWSKLGGRLYQTAICTLSLEVYYRYKAKE